MQIVRSCSMLYVYIYLVLVKLIYKVGIFYSKSEGLVSIKATATLSALLQLVDMDIDTVQMDLESSTVL